MELPAAWDAGVEEPKMLRKPKRLAHSSSRARKKVRLPLGVSPEAWKPSTQGLILTMSFAESEGGDHCTTAQCTPSKHQTKQNRIQFNLSIINGVQS